MKLTEEQFETITKKINKGSTCFMKIKTSTIYRPSQKQTLGTEEPAEALLALNYTGGYFIYLHVPFYEAVCRILPTDRVATKLIRYFFREHDEIVEIYKNIDMFERRLVLEGFLGYLEDSWYINYQKSLTK